MEQYNKQTDITAAMDSVNLINDLCKKEELTIEEVMRIESNIEHLKIIIERHKLEGEEAKVFEDAIFAGENHCIELGL